MPRICVQTGISWSIGAPSDKSLDCSWEKQNSSNACFSLVWQKTKAANASVSSGWSATASADLNTYMAWIKTAQADASVNQFWTRTARADAYTGIGWTKTALADRALVSAWQRSEPSDIRTRMPWGRGIVADFHFSSPWAKMFPSDTRLNLVWGKSTPLDLSVFSDFTNENKVYGYLHLEWFASLGVYFLMQTIELRRASDGEKINIADFTLSASRSAWCWSFSGTICSRADLAKIRPGSSGDVEVILSVNGYDWLFAIDEIGESYKYGSGAYDFSGKSLSCVFAEPYAARLTKIWGDTSAQAIINELVGFYNTYNGRPSEYDFHTVWDLVPDWEIPAGAYSVTGKTPIEIMADIARSAGGYIFSRANERKIEFRKSYPHSPEAWAGLPDSAIADRILPGLILEQIPKRKPVPGYNCVFVSGTDHGVTVKCKKTGTAADRAAPDILDPLVLTEAVAVERGRNELDEVCRNQTAVTLHLPLPAAASGLSPRLLLPGDIIEADDIFGDSWRGIVDSVQVAKSGLAARQTVEVIRHHV